MTIAFEDADGGNPQSLWRAHWASLLREANHVLAPTDTARRLITRVVERNVTLLGGRAAKRAREARLPEGATGYCGLIPLGPSAPNLIASAALRVSSNRLRLTCLLSF